MKIDSKKIKEYFKNAKPMDFAYPVTIIIYVIILVILFSIATKFINENINNKIPSPENKNVQHLLNIDNYVLTAKKLIEVQQKMLAYKSQKGGKLTSKNQIKII